MWGSQTEAQHLFPVQAEEASAAEVHATTAARRSQLEQSLQAALGQSAVAGEHAQANSQSAHLHDYIMLQQLPRASGQRAWACILCATANVMPDSCRRVCAGIFLCTAAGSVSSAGVCLLGLIEWFAAGEGLRSHSAQSASAATAALAAHTSALREELSGGSQALRWAAEQAKDTAHAGMQPRNASCH